MAIVDCYNNTSSSLDKVQKWKRTEMRIIFLFYVLALGHNNDIFSSLDTIYYYPSKNAFNVRIAVAKSEWEKRQKKKEEKTPKMFAHEFICCYRSGMEECSDWARVILYSRIWNLVFYYCYCWSVFWSRYTVYLILLVGKSNASKQAMNKQTNERMKKIRKKKMRL